MKIFLSDILILTLGSKPHHFFLLLLMKLQYIGHLMQRVDSLEKTLMLEVLGAGGEGDDKGWDGWMASLTRWMWIWVNFGSWWWTGRPGVLRFMRSQRVRHDWVTELNWTEWSNGFPYFLQFKSEFGKKEFMICAILISQSCFCWLYRASPSWLQRI